MKAKMISKIILSAWIFVFLFLFAGVDLNVAQAATYTVTTTADGGAGSLRQAILDANANPGSDKIDFNMGPSCDSTNPYTIEPLSSLPAIISPVDLNGYTQPGAAVATANSPATLCIEISGEQTQPLGTNGLTLGAGSLGSTIRGLVINRFRRIGTTQTGNAILITQSGTSGEHWIAGNYLNTNSTGTETFLSDFSTVGHGIRDGGIGGNIIGHNPSGPNSSNQAADRNIISGAGTNRHGILIFNTSSGNNIRGNYIGTDKTGTAALGNISDAMELLTADNTIQANLISGNVGAGIVILDFGIFPAGSNRIIENKIGTDVTGLMALGNAGGMVVESSNNTIKDNVIAFNSNMGIIVAPAPFGALSVSNSILNNSIFNNSPGFIPGLGIDLVGTGPCVPMNCADTGISLNDVLDDDVGGGNNLQNFPVIDVEDSFINPPHVQVRVRLDSKPNQDYLIQGFLSKVADPLGYGEGEVLVAQKTVTTDDFGHADFRLPVPLKLLPVRSIFTTTATDLLTNDTSEFSKWENLDDVQDVRGSPTAYENAAGAAGGDGSGGMPWEWGELDVEFLMIEEEVPTQE